MAQQAGLLTRVQALDLGVSPNLIASLVRSEQWMPVRRGAYCDGEVWRAADPYRGRPLLLAKAALLLMRRDCVLSHDSSAHAQMLDILAPDQPFVHVTRPGFTNAWTKAGVKHHLARYRPDQVAVVEGTRCLDLARTVVDIARERGHLHGVVAADSAMRMGVTRAELEAAYAPMTSWRGVTAARSAVEMANPLAQTVIESLGRDFVWELGIGVPDCQFPVQLGRGTVWGDIRVGNHLFECDGLLKYVSASRGGVAVQPVERVVADEKQRESMLRAEGLGVSRLVYADFFGPRRIEAKRRCLREFRDTVDRYGTELHEHLARNAAAIRARQDRPDSA
jgi:hypothetical protein